MSRRSIYLDLAPGEERGVVALDDEPEMLLIRRGGEADPAGLGARFVARVANVDANFSTAFLDLGDGLQALLPFKADARPIQGQFLQIEIRAEARSDKLPVARALGEATGPARRLERSPDLEAELRRFAPHAEIVRGRDARAIADMAESEALETVYSLPGGGDVAIEPTRALVAVDIDLGDRKSPSAKRAARTANIAALRVVSRLLRLKGLGGLIVIDLVGRGHDGPALMAAARTAFGPDNPGVAIGPIGRFGLMEVSIPWRRKPIMEVLCRSDGLLTNRSLAQRLIRRLEDEAHAQPGARLEARCRPDVAEAAAPLIETLAARMGQRFVLCPDSGLDRQNLEVAAQ